jgi:hypothetical protein
MSIPPESGQHPFDAFPFDAFGRYQFPFALEPRQGRGNGQFSRPIDIVVYWFPFVSRRPPIRAASVFSNERKEIRLEKT